MQVDLPLIEAGADTVGDPVTNLPPPSSARPLSDLDIVVGEDNADAAEMLAVILRDAGAHSRQASDFDSALQLFEDRWPDMLVSDIGLPGRDGYGLIARPREASRFGRPLASVALTAFSRPEDRDKALASGFDAHLPKPFQPHALVAVVVGLVARNPL